MLFRSTKTMPSSALSIEGDFSMSGTAIATALAAITTAGNFTLGAGTTFTAGTLSHSIGGNFENNGATFNTAGSTFTFNGDAVQTIGGLSSTLFDDLCSDNTDGVSFLTNTEGTSCKINGGKWLILKSTSGSGVFSGKIGFESTTSVLKVYSSEVLGSGFSIDASSAYSGIIEIGDGTLSVTQTLSGSQTSNKVTLIIVRSSAKLIIIPDKSK